MVKVTIKARENGSFRVEVDGEKKVSLCRCDKSANKPYCDDTHLKIGFKAKAAEIDII